MRSMLCALAWLLIASSTAVAAPGQHSGASMPMGGTGSQPYSRITSQVPAPLEIKFGDKSAEWTAAKLAALPQQTLTVYNAHAKATQSYSGVPLIDLLTPLGVPAKPRGKELRLYVEAEGSDGYEVVYSLGEITPDVSKGTVMVADSMDGKPLGLDGPLKIVCSDDKRPARWVRNLTNIRVFSAD